MAKPLFRMNKTTTLAATDLIYLVRNPDTASPLDYAITYADLLAAINGGVTPTGPQLSAIGTINDSNVIFNFVSVPTLLVINGLAYQQTGGAITWSVVGTTVTLSSPVGTGGSIFGIDSTVTVLTLTGEITD